MIIDFKKLLYVFFLTLSCLGCDLEHSRQETKGNSDFISKKDTNRNEVDIVSFILNFYRKYSPFYLEKNNGNELSNFLSQYGDDFLTNDLKLSILEDIKCTK